MLDWRLVRGDDRPASDQSSVLAWTDAGATAHAHLVDTTMFFAPKSGGVKRYLLAKRAWLAEHRPGVKHTLVVPGAKTRHTAGMITIAATRVPFADGYRLPLPASIKKWTEHLVSLQPDLIEAGDPYGPGHAALDAGERLGVPVVGFCHSDPAALAALHLGNWAEPPVRRRWARVFRQFDQVIAPSRHIADRLHEAGVFNVRILPLGVDTELFRPDRADREGLRRELDLPAAAKLLVFAGRPAREKNIDVLLDAVEKLGDGYHLLLIGAGSGARPQPTATYMDFRRDPKEVARLLASCDAFVHANHQEPFGLVALEAMASGLPIVGVDSGGIAELVDETVGQLATAPTPEAMAEAIEALFARDREPIALAARTRAESYGWNRTFEALTALYGELAARAEAPELLAQWH